MPVTSRFRVSVAVLTLAFCATAPLFSRRLPAQPPATNQDKNLEPWASTETLNAGEAARDIGKPKDANSPTIIFVGFRTLFEGGHIPGAVFYGTTSAEKGLAEFKQRFAELPRSANLVIYCGCCPLDHCPNIRPAYKALHEMGFTKVRVLVLPTSFAADWVEKGYPIEKGLQ